MPRLHLGTYRRKALTAGLIAHCLISLWACLTLAGQVRARSVAFPSSVGSNVLYRTQIDLGSLLTAETHYQPSSVSYWIGSSMRLENPAGSDYTCRAGLRGWARPQVLTGTPIKIICDCRQPLLHDSVSVSCMAIAAAEGKKLISDPHEAGKP